MKSSRRFFLPIFAVLLPALFGGTLAQALPATWTGAGVDDSWNTGNNWQGGTAPTFGGGDDLIFAGSTRTTPDNPSYNWNANSVSFSSGAAAFTVGNQAINIGAGGITNSSSNLQTFATRINLSADQTWNAASGGIAVTSSYFDGTNKNLTLTGSSSVAISAQMNNLSSLVLEGSGDRSFSQSLNSIPNITVSSTGTNTFLGQINPSQLTVNAGTTTFANVQSSGPINLEGTANVIFSGPVSNNSGGINISSSGDVIFSGTINSGALTLNGTGTTTITGSSNSGSLVTVNEGTLVLNHSGGTALNAALMVNDGGTVSFLQNNQIPGNQTVTLNPGSTMELNNTKQSFAFLDINGRMDDNITIDFGGGASELTIASWGNISIENGLTITIVNWTEGDIFSGANPGANVFNIEYADTVGNIYGHGTWSSGTSYITPDAAPPIEYAPVPEPSEYVLILLGGTFFVLFLRRGLAWFIRRSGQPALLLSSSA